jgi:RNA polymerase sigma-B factor
VVSSTQSSTLDRDDPVLRTNRAARRDPAHQYADLAPLFDVLTDPTLSRTRRDEVRQSLITGYLPVARHIARRYRDKGKPLDDLEQVATLGLINAVDRFDPGRGADFLSFAVPTITGEVRRFFRDTGWSVHVPRRLQEAYQTINQGASTLSVELGRAPRPSEIARHLDLPLEQVLEGLAVGHAYHADPLPDGPSDQSEGKLRPAGDPLKVDDRRLTDVEDRVTLYPAINELPERERTIVVLRFFDNLTQTQIAERMGISQMHVSRLLSQTCQKLRERLSDGPEPTGG